MRSIIVSHHACTLRSCAVNPFPQLGPNVPRRDYGALAAVGRWWLRASGWRVAGDIPDLPKCVAAVAPHSSNWDFVHAVAIVFALGLRISFIGKHTVFVGPLGAFMRWLGGIPVDRSRPEGVADEAVRALAAVPAIWLGIAPQGTRTRGARFKLGFYRIAMAAQLPIVPVSFDYGRRELRFHPPVGATGPIDEGVAAIRALLLAAGVRREDATSGSSPKPDE